MWMLRTKQMHVYDVCILLHNPRAGRLPHNTRAAARETQHRSRGERGRSPGVTRQDEQPSQAGQRLADAAAESKGATLNAAENYQAREWSMGCNNTDVEQRIA
jgi:hypothetical protein